MRKLKRVPLTTIDLEDSTFLIAFMPNIEPLQTSIQLVGLLEPLIVRQRADRRYQLVCGFKRTDALRHLSISHAEAFIYPEGEIDDLQAFLLTMGHNLLRSMNLIEKAHTLQKLLSFGVSERDVIDRYLPLLDLQPNIRVLKQVVALLGLEENVKEYMVGEGLSLSTSTLFLLLDREDQRAIFPLLLALNPGENRVKEIVTFLREISMREGIPIPRLLAKKEINDLLAEQQIPRPQRLERLRRKIKEMRFPRLSLLESRFADYKRTLSLPPQISFHPPPFFESEHFKMELRFKDFRQFQELVAKLLHIAERDRGGGDPIKELTEVVDL